MCLYIITRQQQNPQDITKHTILNSIENILDEITSVNIIKIIKWGNKYIKKMKKDNNNNNDNDNNNNLWIMFNGKSFSKRFNLLFD